MAQKRANGPALSAGSMSRAPIPLPPQQRPEVSETSVGALGATLGMYRVGSKQQPPRRVSPLVMKEEGQKRTKRANNLDVGGG